MIVEVRVSDVTVDEVEMYGNLLIKEGYLTANEVATYGLAGATLRHVAICDLGQMARMGVTCYDAKYPDSSRP